jgi:hypothetical protein
MEKISIFAAQKQYLIWKDQDMIFWMGCEA